LHWVTFSFFFSLSNVTYDVRGVGGQKKGKIKDEFTARNMRHSSPLYEISSLSHTFSVILIIPYFFEGNHTIFLEVYKH
jgi:hypothetical protein